MSEENTATYNVNDMTDILVDKYGISKKQASDYIKTIFEAVSDQLINLNVGDQLKLLNIGIFYTKMTKAGIRRNPQNQSTVEVPSKKVLKFRVLPKFKRTLAGE